MPFLSKSNFPIKLEWLGENGAFEQPDFNLFELFSVKLRWNVSNYFIDNERSFLENRAYYTKHAFNAFY